MNEFEHAFRRVAERYISNVVFIDDQIIFGDKKAEQAMVDQTNALEKAHEGELPVSSALEELALNAPQELVPAVEDETANRLYATEIAEEFARFGVFSSFLYASRDAHDLQASVRLCSAADVVVLDWVVHGDFGDRARSIIGAILADASIHRTRLVLIYTGRSSENDLKQIVQDVYDLVVKVYQESKVESDYAIVADSIRIVVFGKETSDTRDDYVKERILKWKDLPGQVVSEFAIMTAGLVPAVAMRALSAMRDQSKKVLDKFSRSLDSGFLWHRANLPLPGDAEVQLASVVAGEIEAIILDEDLSADFSEDTLRAWLRDRNVEDWQARVGAPGTINLETMLRIVVEGVSQYTAESRELVKLLVSDDEPATPSPLWQKPVFCDSVEEMEAHNARFALITSIRQLYASARKLHLGTIIRPEDATNKALVCLQPLCDSVRISGARQFLFAPAEIARKNKSFDVVVSGTNGIEKLGISLLPYRLRVLEFQSANSYSVDSYEKDGFHYFSDSVGKKYKWLAELNGIQGLRLAHQLGEKLSRVGLDESEWLRFWRDARR